MNNTIRHIVTGELEATPSVTLFNGGAAPTVTREQTLPYGYREDIRRPDGTVSRGTMIPIPVWLIEGSDRTILVDTGLGDIEELADIQSGYEICIAADRAPKYDLATQLQDLGVEPGDIDVVVFTHLHFDHVGNNHLFPNAEFVVQRDEVPQALTPPRYGMFYYPEYSQRIASIAPRMRVIDGAAKIGRGVWCQRVGGHTPGSQVVMVETALGVVAITGDLVYNYLNIELKWPTGSFWNLQELLTAYDQLETEADVILPGHDWKIREYFPDGVIG